MRRWTSPPAWPMTLKRRWQLDYGNACAEKIMLMLASKHLLQAGTIQTGRCHNWPARG